MGGWVGGWVGGRNEDDEDARPLDLLLKRCAPDKSKSCARKPGGPAQQL